MTMPKAVLDFLAKNARQANVAQPDAADDLFKMGILDSFNVVDLVSILEEECGIKIPDEDVNAANFQSVNAMEHYVESRKG
ncbi:MAG: phosphopantetheine-binding protein [Thermoproteota archaeon]|nr:phosphopantetheine-binding protein [Thermoproteota archaeon]